jgi:hypothetical protein
MNKISNNLDSIHKFVSKDFSVKISCSGRKFIIEGHEFALKDIVKKVKAAATSISPADETANKKFYEIAARIKEMDRKGDDKLEMQNFFLKIATFFRRLFGNLGFDRNANMASMIQARLIETFASVSKDLVKTELKTYEHFDSLYSELHDDEKNDLQIIEKKKTICKEQYLKRREKKFSEAEINSYEESREIYCKLFELYRVQSGDLNLNKLFKSIQNDPLHVLYLLSQIEDYSLVLEYQNHEFNWNSDEERDIFSTICETCRIGINVLINPIKKLNTNYEKLKKEADIKGYLKVCFKLIENVNKIHNSDKLKELVEEYNDLRFSIGKSDNDDLYESAFLKLENLCKCSADVNFIIKNLSDKNWHLLYSYLGTEYKPIINFIHYEYEWPNKETREKFEKIKEFKQKNDLIIYINDLNVAYANIIKNGSDPEKELNDILEKCEKSKQINDENFIKLLEGYEKKEIDKITQAHKTIITDLTGSISCKADYELVLKNLSDKNQHLLILAIQNENPDLDKFLSQEFEWPNKEIKDKFEKINEFKQRIKQIQPE